jgi:PleD family two-component response regulator
MAAKQDLLTKAADILVVDDEIASLRLLSEILTKEGYKTRPVEDPQMALEAALAQPPSLLLLDVKMPDMSGYEVCRLLKQDERTRDIPIIFVSALQELGDRIHGFEVGGVDFISKPIQELEVLARVKTHLQLRDTQLHLEQLVAERTAELVQANEALRREITERKQAHRTQAGAGGAAGERGKI